jgi:hypothetical protein
VHYGHHDSPSYLTYHWLSRQLITHSFQCCFFFVVVCLFVLT